MINFTTINNITIRRAADLFGDLNKSITWDLLESTMELTESSRYHHLIDDLLTNDESRFKEDDQEIILPCSYIFASLEHFIESNESSHLSLKLIRELYNHVNFRLNQVIEDCQRVEGIANKILDIFGLDNPNQSVQSWIWDSEEDTYQYKAWLILADICDNSRDSEQVTETVKNYIPTFNY